MLLALLRPVGALPPMAVCVCVGGGTLTSRQSVDSDTWEAGCNHWVLGVVDPRKRSVFSLDSLAAPGTRPPTEVEQWVRQLLFR